MPQIGALRIAAVQNACGVGVCLALKTKLLAHAIASRQGACDFVERIRPAGGARLSHKAKGHAEPVPLLPLDSASFLSSSLGQFQPDLTLVAFHPSTDHQSGVFHRVNHLTNPRFADPKETSQLTGRMTIVMTQQAKDLHVRYAHGPTDACPNGANFQHFFDGPGKHQQAFQQSIHRLDRTRSL